MSGDARIRFEHFEFDPRSGQLLRNGQPIRIQPQPLRVLKLLLERPGQTIPREELREHIWGDATYVEFDQGLNYCIRQIRLALGDNAVEPLYIETLPKQGYRFIADVVQPASAEKAEAIAAPITHIAASPPARTARKPFAWLIATAICALLAIAAVAVYLTLRAPPAALKYTQLTDFTDSATAPALSPDGRMVAFFRGSGSFLTADQIYIKVLPNGEAKRLTDEPRPKYNLAFSPDGSQIAYTVLDHATFATYTVSILGGDPHLFLNNAAGLTWLDQRQLLFSQIRGSGLHMGVVTGTATRQNFREIYFPPHERAMAHYSYASADRKLALVVEMNGAGDWGPCRLISLYARFPVRTVGPDGACTSAFGPQDHILFLHTEGNSNYLERMNPDGSGRSKVAPYSIEDFQGVSPGRRWVMAIAMLDGSRVEVVAIPVGGGPPRTMSTSYCVPTWSPSGRWLFISVEPATRTSPGRSLAIPVGPGETLPPFPPAGIPPQADPSIIPGAQSVARADLVPGLDPSHYVYVNTSVHRNLYRISLR